MGGEILGIRVKHMFLDRAVRKYVHGFRRVLGGMPYCLLHVFGQTVIGTAMLPLNPSNHIGRLLDGGGVLDGRHVLDLMHDRSRMTIDPRIPAMPGRKHVGFSSTRQTFACTKREAP